MTLPCQIETEALQSPSTPYQTMTEVQGQHRGSGSWTGLKQTLALVLNDEMALGVSILSLGHVGWSLCNLSKPAFPL